MTIHDPLHPTAEALFQEFLETFAKSAIEAYQYFDAEYSGSEDQSRDAAVTSVLDEGHLGPDMFAGTGADLFRSERDAAQARIKALEERIQVRTELNTRIETRIAQLAAALRRLADAVKEEQEAYDVAAACEGNVITATQWYRTHEALRAAEQAAREALVPQ